MFWGSWVSHTRHLSYGQFACKSSRAHHSTVFTGGLRLRFILQNTAQRAGPLKTGPRAVWPNLSEAAPLKPGWKKSP